MVILNILNISFNGNLSLNINFNAYETISLGKIRLRIT